MRMSPLEAVVAFDIFDIGAIEFGAFRLKLHDTNPNVPLSPIYVNLRLLRSFPVQRQRAALLLKMYLGNNRVIRFDILADIPTAATPIVTSLSDLLYIGFISPKISKTHGLTGEIDGVYEKGQTVLIIDDLVTKADSKIEAAEVVEKNGLVVKDILVLVDREQGGEQALAEAGYKLHSIFKFTNMLKLYLEYNRITQQKCDEVMAYLKNN